MVWPPETTATWEAAAEPALPPDRTLTPQRFAARPPRHARRPPPSRKVRRCRKRCSPTVGDCTACAERRRPIPRGPRRSPRRAWPRHRASGATLPFRPHPCNTVMERLVLYSLLLGGTSFYIFSPTATRSGGRSRPCPVPPSAVPHTHHRTTDNKAGLATPPQKQSHSPHRAPPPCSAPPLPLRQCVRICAGRGATTNGFTDNRVSEGVPEH